jgi:hypothetical protein
MNKNYISPIILVVIILAIGIFLAYRYNNSDSPNKYGLIYCMGHSSTVEAINIFDGKIVEPDREGFLESESYDYKFYLLNTNNFSRRNISIDDLNNSDIIFSEVSPDGINLLYEERDWSGAIGGLVMTDIYIRNQGNKELISTEESPTNIFRIIGWIRQ